MWTRKIYSCDAKPVTCLKTSEYIMLHQIDWRQLKGSVVFMSGHAYDIFNILFPTTFSKHGIKQKFKGLMSRTKWGFKEEEWRGLYNVCNMIIGTGWWEDRYKWVRGWRWGRGETKSKLSIFKNAIRN